MNSRETVPHVTFIDPKQLILLLMRQTGVTREMAEELVRQRLVRTDSGYTCILKTGKGGK